MQKGRFIVLEGGEGAGKSSQCARLTETLNARGYDAVATREPGGVVLAEKLRELILSPSYSPDGLTELYMYCAARREHLIERVFPMLEKGKIVVCDRFVYSTVAYQGYGRGLDTEFVRAINAMTISPLKVDLAIFLDVPPEVGFSRKGGADGNDRMEQSGSAFFKKVYDGFKSMCERGEMTRVDGTGTFDEVAAKILELTEKVL